MSLTLASPWASGGAVKVNSPPPPPPPPARKDTPRSKEEGKARMRAEMIPTQAFSGCRNTPRPPPPRSRQKCGRRCCGSRCQVPPRPPLHRPGLGSLGLWSLSIPTLHRVCHPPSRGLPGLCSGRAGGTEGVGSGHLQHRVSFHLCKDSLTPEHINILNDSERSWDSRQPQAPLPPSPRPPPPPTHSSFLLFFLPPCLLSTFLLSHSCLFSLLSPSSFSVLTFFLSFFSPSPFSLFSLLSPPLLFSFSPKTPQLLCIHQLSPCGLRGPVPLSVCPSPAGPRCLPRRERALEAAPTRWGPGGGGRACHRHPEAQAGALSFCLLPRGTGAWASHCPRHAGKGKSQVGVWGAVGEGSVLGRIFCFVFFMAIYNFAFLPSAPASLAPRCVPH